MAESELAMNTETLLRLLEDENGAYVDLDDLKAKIESGDVDPSFQKENSGESLMMLAAKRGMKEVVKLFLEGGAPWNALDRKGRCAGEFALENGHQEIVDMLVDHGVRAEMILGAIEKRRIERRLVNEDYLKSSVEFTDDKKKLMDAEGEAVMMEWEKPVMNAHARLLCKGIKAFANEEGVETPLRDVLNVGFGMGIIDSFIQEFGAKTHIIIEAHPDVYDKMIKDGWGQKSGVRIVFGRWQDKINELGPFDSIFFDSYGEFYSDMQDFHGHLPKLLRPGGIYSFFNGLCPRNIFFHGVVCEVVRLELAALGLECSFANVEISDDVLKRETWAGVSERYFWRQNYYLPIVIRKG